MTGLKPLSGDMYELPKIQPRYDKDKRDQVTEIMKTELGAELLAWCERPQPCGECWAPNHPLHGVNHYPSCGQYVAPFTGKKGWRR